MTWLVSEAGLLGCIGSPDEVNPWPGEEAHRSTILHVLDAPASGVSWERLWREIPSDIRDDVAVASVSHDRIQEAAQSFHPDHQALLAKLELPRDADDQFDRRFIAAARRCGLWDNLIVDRLLTLPLTQLRARHVVAISLTKGRLWTLERRLEIAEAAGELTEEVQVPTTMDPSSIAAFRILAGSRALARMVEHFNGLVLDGRVEDAAELHAALPELASHERRAVLFRLACSLPIAKLAEVQQRNAWLLSEADVLAEASRPEREDWGWCDRLPAYLLPAICRKAVQTPTAGLSRSLLDRAEALGKLRRQVLALVAERIQTHGPASFDRDWLARKLDTKALWDSPGSEIISHLLLGSDQNAGANVALEICSIVVTRLSRPDLTRVIHTVVGSALLDVAEQAINAGDFLHARNALTGLAHLTPALRLRVRVRALQRRELPEGLRTLVEANDNLLRRDQGDASSIDAVLDALAALVSVSAGGAS